MSSYIGKVQVESGDYILIGSTLYGECDTQAATAAKTVTLASFDTVMDGITVNVRFNNGNSVLTGVTLAINTTDATPVRGNCICEANEIIAFTYKQEDASHKYWQAERGVKIESANDIVTKIGGQEVNVATKTYVDNKTAGLSGLTGAMHFKGITTTEMTDGRTTAAVTINSSSYTPEAGDVVLYNSQEYVWVETNTSTHAGYWELLGDEGSYVLQTSQQTGSVGSASGWNAGSAPTLGTEIPADDITNWSAGSASSATVVGGILKLTNSVVPTLTYTAKSIPNVTSVGSVPSLTVTSTDVIVPTVPATT